MMALTWTYLPPTCARTSAYSFSAPTATILPPPEPDEPDVAAVDEEQALASSATPIAAPIAAAVVSPRQPSASLPLLRPLAFT